MSIYKTSSPSAKNSGAVLGLHPLIAAAAVALIALSGVGITTMLMNRSGATTAPAAVIEAPEPVAALPDPVPEPAKAVEVQPEVAPVPKPAHKTDKHAPVVASGGPRNEPAAPVYNMPVTQAPIAQAPAVCRECAVVEGTREVKVQGQGSGLGAIAGGVVGGLLGNRVGAGNGRALATIAGAVGGGYAGNSIEKSQKAGVEYELIVRFEDGTTQTFKRTSPWPYGRGDQVKVVDNQIVSRG